ncbi:MAG: GAF domain-containing SpoIIE family protein phosphatase, partial [Vulcanimicrobiaceae bacterium]
MESADVLSSTVNRRAVLHGFAQVAVRNFCDGCMVVFCEGENFRLGAFAHRDAAAKPSIQLGYGLEARQGGPLQQVARTKKPFLRNGMAEGSENLPEIERLEIASFIATPMMVEQRLIGILCFISSDESRRFEQGDVEVAMAAARQVAVGLENIRSFERFRLLGRATDQLFTRGATAEKLRSLLEVIVDEVADWAAIYSIRGAEAVRVQDVLHRDPEKNRALGEIRGQRVFTSLGERNLFDAVSNRRSILRSKVGLPMLREELRSYIVPVFAQAMPQSALTVPLFTSEQVYGALTIYAEHYSFSEGELELMQEIARRVALAFEHDESVERQRRLTQTLQEVTLPASLPEIPNTLVSTVYTPAATSDAQLGGDWYDIFDLRDGRFLLTIGDVTGRGLQASAIMGKLRHSINVVAMYEPNPVSILDAAEKVVQQRYPDAIATTFVAIYDKDDQSIVYANAGHPYPILRLRDGSTVELAAEGLPIGLRWMNDKPQPRSRTVRDVEAMAFYTDGVTEANRDSEAGERCLMGAINSGALPFVRNAAVLIASACLPPQAHDDAAILTLTFPQPTTWLFQADHAKAATEARWAFVNQLRREGVDQEDVD